MPDSRRGCTTVMLAAALLVGGCLTSGCTTDTTKTRQIALDAAIERYADTRSAQLPSTPPTAPKSAAGRWRLVAAEELGPAMPYFTLGTMPEQDPQTPETQPAADQSAPGERVPEEYWRKDVWHQMGHEAQTFGTRGLWRGFKTSFWDVENALTLTAAMGASVAIRETGVDATIRNRTHGHRQLGDGGEVIGVLGNPATHFAGTGILWLASTLTKDAEQHEVARALTEALSVTGITTLGLKFAAGTREPDGDRYAWPSGHTASTTAVAAVLNEYYGPWASVPCFALAGLVGYERIDSREHDLSDVVFGAVLGYVVGTSIARDEKAQLPELWGMKVVPFTDVETGASGLALMKSW